MGTISLRLSDGSTYVRTVEVFADVRAEECSYTQNKYKIIVTLKKSVGGEWDRLEREIDDGKTEKGVKGPWTTKRDWAQVQKYATEELEKDKPEGDEALQSLFSKIYGDADDDQRRAMNKSFQTSGGTVLSTNWGDVKDKDYEGKDRVLPTGQDVKKWEH